MRLSRVRAGDVVRCNVGGRVFYAEAGAAQSDGSTRGLRLAVVPITHNVNYYSVKAQEVTATFRKLKS